MIEQTDNSIKITIMHGREASMIQTLTFNGKEYEQIALQSNYKFDARRSVAKWLDDGKELTTSSSYILDDKGHKGNDTMTIQNGSLVVKTTRFANRPELSTRWVYDKQ